MRSLKRLPLLGVGLAALLALALLSAPPEATRAQAQYQWPQSGHVYNQNGYPVNDFHLIMVGSQQGVLHTYTETDGSYVFYANAWEVFTIEPFDGSVDATPPSHSGQATAPHSNYDFSIVTIGHVSGSIVNAPGGNLELGGIRITVGGSYAATTDATGHFGFSTFDGHILPPLPPMQGTATPQHSFYSFSPAGLAYDSRPGDVQLAPITVTLANIAAAGVAEYSWDNPGGEGWSYFPLDPYNRATNNPNVVVEVDFDDALMSTPVPADHVRLLDTSGGMLQGALYPVEELNSANGWTARFETPIGNCGRGELGVYVGIDTQTRGRVWQSLSETLETGTSHLDLNDDGVMNLADIVLFSGTYGRSEGDPLFLPCADYAPDGVIDLSDITVFTTYYNMAPPRTPVDQPTLEAISGLFTIDPISGKLSMAGDEPVDAPMAVGLSAQPNPFNPKTTLSFALNADSRASLTIYDISGRTVRHLLDGASLAAGPHSVEWQGRDDAGSPVATGVYFARLDTAEGRVVQKLTILK